VYDPDIPSEVWFFLPNDNNEVIIKELDTKANTIIDAKGNILEDINISTTRELVLHPTKRTGRMYTINLLSIDDDELELITRLR
jgi:hypothetical protein